MKQSSFAISMNGKECLDVSDWGGEFPSELTWYNVDLNDAEGAFWLSHLSGLKPLVVQAITEKLTRPRYLQCDEGVLVILRGINFNPDSDPDDMVSVRVWIEPGRIITVQRRGVKAILDMKSSIKKGTGPASPGSFLSNISLRLTSRMEDYLIALDDKTDELEDALVSTSDSELRSTISNLRKNVIKTKRYLAPQKDVIQRLSQSTIITLFSKEDQTQLKENANVLVRYVEDLDLVKDRVQVIQDELEHLLSSSMNQTMFTLSVVAALFMPLGFLTGLLGINVGGIPGSESPIGFFTVCLIMSFIAFLQIMYFRKLKWL